MEASIFQLAGAIMLSILSVMKARSFELILPVVGRKHPNALNNLKEQWTISVGLVYVVIGYAIQIIDWDIKYINDLDSINKIVISLIFVIILCVLGLKLSNKISSWRYKKTPNFDPHA